MGALKLLLFTVLASRLAAAGADAIEPARDGVFDCGAGFGREATVPDSFVDDGVCDCCSGADEGASLLSCPDVCFKRTSESRSLLSAYTAAVDKGAARAAKLVLKPKDAASLVDGLSVQLRQLASQLQDMHGVLQAEGGRLQREIAAGKRVSQARVDAFQEKQRLLQRLSGRANVMQTQAQVDFGPNRRYAALLADPSCMVSPILSEKVTKGGSTTSTPKVYAYVVCGYANVTQVEAFPDAWERGEAAAKGQGEDGRIGEEEVLVGVDGRVEPSPAAPERPRGRLAGSPTLLGHFAGYLPLSRLDEHTWSGLIDNPGVYGGTRNVPKPPALTLSLPPLASAARRGARGGPASVASVERDLASVAAVYQGLDECVSGSMVLSRRVYVLHVCPGHAPAHLQAARDAVGRAAADGGKEEAGWAESEGRGAHRYLPGTREWNAERWDAHTPHDFTAAALDAVLGRTPAPASSSSSSRSSSSLGKVVAVYEDGMCTYRIYVATPLACSKQRARDVKAALAAAL